MSGAQLKAAILNAESSMRQQERVAAALVAALAGTPAACAALAGVLLASCWVMFCPLTALPSLHPDFLLLLTIAIE
jgi:hypothetical protein